jgi:hypothetical protein
MPDVEPLTDSAIVARLRAEHVPVTRRMIDRVTDDLWDEERCDVCHVSWPCPTALTLRAAHAK